AGAHAAALRAALERCGLHLGDLVAAPLADQLLDGWHLPAFSVASSGLCTAVLLGSVTPRPGVSQASAAGLTVAWWTCELARRAGTRHRKRLNGRARTITIPGPMPSEQTRSAPAKRRSTRVSRPGDQVRDGIDDRRQPRPVAGLKSTTAFASPRPDAESCPRTPRRRRYRPSHPSSPATRIRAARPRTRATHRTRPRRRARRTRARRSPARPR